MKIDNNIPAPTTSGKGASGKYPLNTLAVGDSFLCSPEVNPYSMRVLIQYHQNQHGKRYTTRTTLEGLRVWRIK